jgi:transcriptional regulator with XRE-family HTH domain
MDDLDEDGSAASLLGAICVRLLRRRHGLAQAAETMKLSARTLQRYESGDTTPGPETLARLAHHAGFSRALLDRVQGALDAHRLATAGGLARDPDAPPRSATDPFVQDILAAALEAVQDAEALLAIEPAPRQRRGRA